MQDDRPFIIKSVAKPRVVDNHRTDSRVLHLERAEDQEYIYRYVCKIEDLASVTSCTMHKYCKGHHIRDQNDSA